nr:MAG TPA: 3-hydroxyacyl-CoA dehydrogenase [Caudoviricetes sp.]
MTVRRVASVLKGFGFPRGPFILSNMPKNVDKLP